uniref:Uncharacterized protein n=1 Tax=viral metagenome TaxID=1070528 RepID=A0A6H1ZR83_9ZZZZ
MPEIYLGIDCICENCGDVLTATFEQGRLVVSLCKDCLNKMSEESFEDGYKRGRIEAARGSI